MQPLPLSWLATDISWQNGSFVESYFFCIIFSKIRLEKKVEDSWKPTAPKTTLKNSPKLYDSDWAAKWLNYSNGILGEGVGRLKVIKGEIGNN